MQTGIQLSSFKPLMKTEQAMRETFLRTAALGCTLVQLQWVGPSIPTETIAQALEEAGLVSISVQDFFDTVRADAAYYLRLNEQTGAKWLCVSRIPERMKTPEGLEAMVHELRTLSETAQRQGQKLCFHPVASDYQAIGGKCPVDELLVRLPDMPLCLDLFHLARAGYILPAWMESHRGRIEMVHFKDEKNGLLVPAGQGTVPYGGAVKACLQAHVAYGFVEQESWDRDPFVCLGEALGWLRAELSAAQTERP